MGHEDLSSTLKYQRCREEDLMDDFPSYKALLESLENGALKGIRTKISRTKSYYTPHTSLRQMD